MIGFGKLLGKIGESRAAKTALNFGKRQGPKAVKTAMNTRIGSDLVRAASTETKKALVDAGVSATSIRKAVIASKARQQTKVVKGAIPKQDFFSSISKISPRVKKNIGTGALLGIGAVGFMNGVDSKNQVSNAVYDLAFNDPNYDERVLGKKMGIRSVLMPMPGEMTMKSTGAGLGRLIGQPAGSLLTKQTFTDAWQANRKHSPRVDGSIAFGMYNARLG